MRRYSSTAQATTLSAGCTSSATSIQVTATTGFPAVDFILALDYGAAGQELVLVTNVAGTTLTVTRGYNSTPAAAHSLGAVVRHVHAAIDFTDSRTHEAATSAVHGLAGTVVGTTDVQALSNKDLSSGTNTFPAALATDAEVTSAVSTHAALTVTHGATGAVMGTTNAQVVTNKDLTSGTNTFPTSLATLTGVQTLTNKTLSTGTKVGAATTDVSGAWTTWAPTWTNLTVGNAVIVAKYMQVGKIVHVRRNVTGGTTTAATGAVSFTLPVATEASGIQLLYGFYGAGATTGVALGSVAAGASSMVWQYAAPSILGISTFGNTDVFRLQGTYEVA